MPMGGEPGRRRLSGWAKPTLAAAVAILVGGGVWLAVPDTSPGQSGFAASLRHRGLGHREHRPCRLGPHPASSRLTSDNSKKRGPPVSW